MYKIIRELRDFKLIFFKLTNILDDLCETFESIATALKLKIENQIAPPRGQKLKESLDILNLNLCCLKHNGQVLEHLSQK